MGIQSAAKDSIHIDITLDAPIEKVWQAWTDPAIVIRWFGSDPKGMGLSASIDLRPAGLYEIGFQDADGTVHTCYGSYIIINPFTHLRLTWTWKNEPGIQSMVIVHLISIDDTTTLMHFEHAGFGFESTHQYQEGWTRTFEKLSNLLRGNLH